jgi:hypothetical protein
VRPCPTCDCFVPVAARRCPRCAATLAPVCEEAGAQHPVLVAAGNAARENGSADPPAGSVVARLALPPIDSPALRPRRPQLPKLPQPYAPDPLVLAVFLGIPPVAPGAEATPTNGHDIEPLAGSRNTFGALLGTTVTNPAPAPAPAGDDLLPFSPPATPSSPPAPVAVPLAAADIAVPGVSATPRRVRTRRSRRDPFARSTTRRERTLTRLCMTLAITLALAVVMLRLPLGARPELGASDATGTSAPPVASSPFTDAIREQTHADLQAVISVAQRLDLVFRSYVPDTPVLLNRYLPQFGFVARTESSTRVGEMSVATSTHVFVAAEYAGPGQCVFARVIDRHTATSVGPTNALCSAASTPKFGWTTLSR